MLKKTKFGSKPEAHEIDQVSATAEEVEAVFRRVGLFASGVDDGCENRRRNLQFIRGQIFSRWVKNPYLLELCAEVEKLEALRGSSTEHLRSYVALSSIIGTILEEEAEKFAMLIPQPIPKPEPTAEQRRAERLEERRRLLR